MLAALRVPLSRAFGATSSFNLYRIQQCQYHHVAIPPQ
jgi:hypothetical protein